MMDIIQDVYFNKGVVRGKMAQMTRGREMYWIEGGLTARKEPIHFYEYRVS